MDNRKKKDEATDRINTAMLKKVFKAKEKTREKEKRESVDLVARTNGKRVARVRGRGKA